MKTKISMITVSFNSEETIKRTIQSVLDQTYENVEYIIVDGASTDSTMDIVRSFEASFDGRLKYISEPDKGMYNAMNKGIKMATGDVIGIINSDDWYEKDAARVIADAYESMEDKEPAVFCAVTHSFAGNDLRDSSYLDPTKLRSQGMSSHPSCFVTRDAYDILGGFDEKYRYVGDYDLMMRAYEKYGIRFIKVDHHVSNYVLGGASASHKAYIELLGLQKRYRIISFKEWLVNKFKAELADLFVKHGLNPISMNRSTHL